MSKRIIRVVRTELFEYDPYDEDGNIEEFYAERGCTSLAECMEYDRKITLGEAVMPDGTADDEVNGMSVEEWATKKDGQTSHMFNIVLVPDEYDVTDSDSLNPA